MINIKNWLIIIGAILFLVVLILSVVSAIPSPEIILIYTVPWKNAQPQTWFIDDIEYTIDSDGYANIRIYVGDKLEYMDCIWNIQFIEGYVGDYLKWIQKEVENRDNGKKR